MIALFCTLFGLWCSTIQAEITTAQPLLPTQTITLTNGSITHSITAEIANETHERQTGLMHRTSVPAGTGMLFIWEKPFTIGMWMKNTPTPLDMLFFNNNQLLGYVENTVPFSLDVVGIPAKSNMVLELAAGSVQNLNLNNGTNWTLKIKE